jgi:Arc/MetJ-type ribon-helix-helix transcriptional regulator
MVRTQIQLSKEEYERLRSLAGRLRRSMADCIREGIRLFLDRSVARADDLKDIAGKFRPLPQKDLKRHDRWLAEAILSKGGRRRR